MARNSLQYPNGVNRMRMRGIHYVDRLIELTEAGEQKGT